MLLRRSLLLVALAGLLLNSLDCYGAWLTGAQARKCCASGHCSPANRDSCCKNSPAGASQAFKLQPKASVPAPIPHIVGLIPPPVDLLATVRLERLGVGS